MAEVNVIGGGKQTKEMGQEEVTDKETVRKKTEIGYRIRQAGT